jgi:hypothetical protein
LPYVSKSLSPHRGLGSPFGAYLIEHLLIGPAEDAACYTHALSQPLARIFCWDGDEIVGSGARATHALRKAR